MNTHLSIEITKPGGLNVLRVVERPLPACELAQVLIRIECAGVAFPDVLMREGLYPNVPRRQLIPGYDVVGEIVAVGEQVTDFKPGQRVAALTQTGGYAEHITVDQSRVVPCPTRVTGQEAVALILNYTTAYQMLTRIARVKAGETALVHGAAGGVGSALVQLAPLLGVTVYGTLSTRKIRTLGGTDFISIDYQKRPFQETLAEQVPVGVDIVFDAIGGRHLKHSYQALAPGGRLVTYGFSTSIRNGRRHLLAAAREMAASLFSPIRLLNDNRAVMGYGIWTLAQTRPDWFTEDLSLLFRWLEEGKINPIIGKVLPLTDAREAQRLMQTSEVVGKVVLDCREAHSQATRGPLQPPAPSVK